MRDEKYREAILSVLSLTPGEVPSTLHVIARHEAIFHTFMRLLQDGAHTKGLQSFAMTNTQEPLLQELQGQLILGEASIAHT